MTLRVKMDPPFDSQGLIIYTTLDYTGTIRWQSIRVRTNGSKKYRGNCMCNQPYVNSEAPNEASGLQMWKLKWGWLFDCRWIESYMIEFHLRPNRPWFSLGWIFSYTRLDATSRISVDFLENEARYQEKLLFIFYLEQVNKSRKRNSIFWYCASFSRKSTLKFLTMRPVANREGSILVKVTGDSGVSGIRPMLFGTAVNYVLDFRTGRDSKLEKDRRRH